MGARRTPKLSVVLATWNRPEALRRCIRSLDAQTCKDFEVVVQEGDGVRSLPRVRNEGIQKARGRVVSLIDDDTVCPPEWVGGVLDAFDDAKVVGVTGPAIIPPANRLNRDVLEVAWRTQLYEHLFVDHRDVPGHLCPSGAVTLCSADPSNKYEGEVDYLEACNMAFRREALQDVGGFDEAYLELGEWSEPDLCFRIRKSMPGSRLLYTQAAGLRHCTAAGATTNRRKRIGSRLANYGLFSRRWIRPSLWHTAYWAFLRTYYAQMEVRGWLNSLRTVRSTT